MKYLIIYLLTPLLLLAQEVITPIPNTIENLDTKKVALGKALFFDKRLSKDNSISCFTCHNIALGGADNKTVAVGIDEQKGTVNTPTILNSKFNFVQFWDGRSKDLQAQVSGPIHNPIEMNSNFNEIIKKLSDDTFYKKVFKDVYDSQITEENIINAIVEYEKSLVTPDSKFDKYLKGDENILTHEEKKGYKLFKEFGCISCHNGVNIGGNLFQKIGIMEEYFPEKAEHLGRYNITNNEDDKFYFKVPTLRNIELTSPYLHDGSIKNLSDAIEVMLKYQIGAIYTKQDIDFIEKFLKTLTGETPKLQ